MRERDRQTDRQTERSFIQGESVRERDRERADIQR